MVTKKKTAKKKPEFSVNKKLENILQDIKYDLLHHMGANKREAISEIRRYVKTFPKEPDHNLAQYGNVKASYYDIRRAYKKAGYGSTIDKMNDERLWNTYMRQVGYVARHILANNK